MPATDFITPELETLDQLIAGLESLIVESDESPFTIAPNEPPRRAVYRILGNTGALDRKPKIADALFLNEARLVLRCIKTEVVRMMPLEVMVQAEKGGRGETLVVIIGKVHGLKRVRGGYEVEINVMETRKSRITPGQKLEESLRKNDAAAWNRWCQDIKESIELVGMDLRKADLTGYDLCCANLAKTDLSGANLTNAILAGADLTNCNLEGAVVTGADFFRATMRRDQAALLTQSGMPEVESVVLSFSDLQTD